MDFLSNAACNVRPLSFKIVAARYYSTIELALVLEDEDEMKRLSNLFLNE